MTGTGRDHNLFGLLALHVTLSLCGSGHHSLDAIFAPNEVHESHESKAVLGRTAGDCVVCQFLSLPALLTVPADPVGCDNASASSSGSISAVLLPASDRLTTTPRAPPCHPA